LIGKLIIIGAIVIALFVFVPGAYKMIGAPALDAVKQRIDYTTSDKMENVTAPVGNTTNQHINGVTPVSIYQLDPKYLDKETYTGQVFQKTGTTCDISVPSMTQTVNGQKELTHIIEIGQCFYDVGQPVQVTTLAVKSDAPQQATPPSAVQIVPYASPNPTNPTSNGGNSVLNASASEYPSLPPYYQVIFLNAENIGNQVIISYDDTTGKTTLVTVALRNSNGQIFTGKFTSSQFQTKIKDVPDMPHIFDMTVTNSAYGTLYGSVYVPSNIKNSTVNGIFIGP
jgi:hypothetical protein